MKQLNWFLSQSFKVKLLCLLYLIAFPMNTLWILLYEFKDGKLKSKAEFMQEIDSMRSEMIVILNTGMYIFNVLVWLTFFADQFLYWFPMFILLWARWLWYLYHED